MSVIAQKSAAFEMRGGHQALTRAAANQRYSLRATEDGWSLLAPSGEVIFRGFGLASRRACLEFARDSGVLAVVS
jgi:hypothetical protein